MEFTRESRYRTSEKHNIGDNVTVHIRRCSRLGTVAVSGHIASKDKYFWHVQTQKELYYATEKELEQLEV